MGETYQISLCCHHRGSAGHSRPDFFREQIALVLNLRSLVFVVRRCYPYHVWANLTAHEGFWAVLFDSAHVQCALSRDPLGHEVRPLACTNTVCTHCSYVGPSHTPSFASRSVFLE